MHTFEATFFKNRMANATLLYRLTLTAKPCTYFPIYQPQTFYLFWFCIYMPDGTLREQPALIIY
jgi:hypothetical protein